MEKTDRAQVLTKKKRSTHKRATICIQSRHFPIVDEVAKSLGLDVKCTSSTCDLYWCDTPMVTEELKNLKKYQKINHFPGMSEICRKDLLARNLNTMAKYFKDDYNFFPRTWSLPSDYGKLQDYMNNHKASTYILKPTAGSRGTGIYLTKHLKKNVQPEQMICQLYISKLMLMDGYKFDMRVYTLITSCDPLKIYVYNDGLARLATVHYKKPSDRNMNNAFMHLTNYSVNKNSELYIDNEVIGSKRRITTVNSWLSKNGYNVKKIWQDIDDAIIKTIILAYPSVKHNYKVFFSDHVHTQGCFELLGFDVILDEDCKPYLLEVNRSPDLHTTTSIDQIVKRELLMDTFKLLQLDNTYKNAVSTEQTWRTRQCALKADKDIFKQRKIDCKTRYEQQSNEWESKNMGNYRLIFSEKNISSYEHFFYQNENKLYQYNYYRSSLFREPAMSIKKPPQIELINQKNVVVKQESTINGQVKQVVNRTKNFKSQVFTTKKILAPITANKTKSVINKKKESLIPVIPRYKTDDSLMSRTRVQTSNINPKIIKRVPIKKKCNQPRIESSKKLLCQIAGAVECSNSLEIIKIMKKNNKKMFPDIQSCLFNKYSNKKKSFSSCWVSESIDQIEEDDRIGRMFSRTDNIFKLGVKEYIYKAFEKLNNVYEHDRVDYEEYKRKRESFGYEINSYKIVNINFDGRCVHVEEKICQEI